uniref:lipopolysaccharide biosynthesis protein n=1 Tax=Alistipes sp. TaxID=1872444 RepID=UPI0040573DBB
MLVQLYASRVMLSVLEESDYGIYNVVAGIVILFSFLNTALSSATQRYLTLSIGQNDLTKASKIFNTSRFTHLVIALLIGIIAEVFGLWFISSKMNIPPNRMRAALWVFQLSLISFCLQVLRVPYNAIIIAYEKMSFYAFASIAEAIIKLANVYLLLLLPGDKIIIFSILSATSVLLINAIYITYCKKSFNICREKTPQDLSLFKELLSFSGWNLLGHTSNVAATQGLNILLNIFVGLVANAAMGIVNQVTMATNAFVSGFQVAYTPQLVKLYASGRNQDLFSLIFSATRLSYFLILIVGLPIIIFCEELFHLWLNDVPEYSVQFTRLFIIYHMIDSLTNPLWNTINATGKIKLYQSIMAFLTMLNIPIAYIILRMGGDPSWAVATRVLISAFLYIIRIFYLKIIINFPIWEYAKVIGLKIIPLTVFSTIIPIYLHSLETNSNLEAIIFPFISALSTSAVIFAIGLTVEERTSIKKKVVSILQG